MLKKNSLAFDFIAVGGGAAGFFAAINAAYLNPKLKIAIIEKNREVLQKVRVSGGGRCNVTNVCQRPEELIKNYPRGNAHLLKPFESFGSKDTVEWFESRNIKLKAEADGRIFPASNSSQTIIDFFLFEINRLQISLFTSQRVLAFEKKQNSWTLSTDKEEVFETKSLMLATGSDVRIWNLLESLAIKTIAPVPSLFTFNIKESALNELQGVSFQSVSISILKTSFNSMGPFLITHWGVSGPGVLKLSAWAARELEKLNYKFDVKINWLHNKNNEFVINEFKENLLSNPKKNVVSTALFGLTTRFWKYICEKSNIKETQKWAETGKKTWIVLAENLTACIYEVSGKSTFKEEFVTAGGVDLDEVNFESFSLKKHPSIYLSGEVLDIDAVTGGFNFQSAWTGAIHVANAVCIEL